MIFLITGFMGAGKSTFLENLKKNDPQQIDFIDLDQQIFFRYSSQHHENLGQLIEEIGWPAFRKQEEETLGDLIVQLKKKGGDHFISLGGGALSEKLLKNISPQNEVVLVWLQTPFDTCWKRIEGDVNRPLVKKGYNYLKNLYEEREKIYQNARICLSAPDQDIVWTIQKLKEEIGA